MKKWLLPLFLVAVAALVGGYVYVSQQIRVEVPPYSPPPAELVHLEQGWSPAEWTEFHHRPQGTLMVPYDWFMALERPCLSPGNCGSFAAPEYLSRFGFLVSGKDETWNPDGLPVGFARQEDFEDPRTDEKYAALGLTCAACHTGELHYEDTAVRIEGGPAVINVGEFQKALGIALGMTAKFPFSLWRYPRFERAVLGAGATEGQRAKLKKAIRKAVDDGEELLKMTAEVYADKFDAGFTRTDALNRIGNQVFAVDMQNPANLHDASAPVRYPQIWDASWLDWVQYNSSIADPLVRNIGESLGVRAVLKMYGDDAGAFNNSVDVASLKRLEDLLSGTQPYGGLRSPKWPEQFPALDTEKVAEGKGLYRQLCQRCHLPPVEELRADLARGRQGGASQYWWRNAKGLWLLKVTDVPLEVIGTDRNQAVQFNERRADSGALGAGEVTAGQGLDLVTKAIAKKYFDANGFTPQQRLEWSGMRDPDDPAVREPLVYKARPLNGIWAVAPYLHNGSVPTLYLLLAPKNRPSVFYTGSKEFDPKYVGYRYTEFEGAYEFNTSQPGSSNTGHRFEGDGSQLGDGVIGRELTDDERFALIEYLKSI